METEQAYETQLCSTSNTIKQEDIIYSKLESRIIKIIQDEGYVTHAINKRMISTLGNNYASVLLELDIKGKTKAGDKTTNVFIKYVLPDNGVKFVDFADIFANEVLMYQQLAPVFTTVQDEAGVPLEDRYRIPKSYAGCDVDAIILDNVAIQGFKTLYKMDVTPLKFAELSVEQLAKFHGLSFVLEVKRPDIFISKIKSVQQPFNFNQNWLVFTKKLREITMESLSDDMRARVEKFIPTMIEKHPKYLSGVTSSVKCLCHGDYRQNNILTRIVDGETVEILPLDYQLMYYGSPVVDLIYFIFSASDKQFRHLYMNHLKDLYYSSLERFLRYFNIDVDSVYPRKVFENDFEESLDYGLIYSLMFLPFSFTSEQEDCIPDFANDNALEQPFLVDDRFKERLTGILEDYIEWGIL